MLSIVFEILIIFILLVANGLFSGSEIAIVSARKVRLEQLANQNNKKAKEALKLANSPNNFLSAVQFGITLIGILSGTVGGATLVERLQRFFDTVPVVKPYSQTLSIVIVVSLITYFSLIIGELVPKRIALNSPETIASNVAKPMRLLTKMTSPLVYLLSASTDGILKILGIKINEEQTVTAEEIQGLVEQGARAGLFEIAEQEMVRRVFRLGDRPIRSIMTPRPEIVWLDIESPLSETQQEILESNYSYFPVGEETIDNCLGIISAKIFLSQRLSETNFELRNFLQPPPFIPENRTILDVLQQFRESRQHMALITDEYGDVKGLVTLKDLTEALVGSLPNQGEEEPQIIQREDGSWLLDGLLSIDELKELLNRDTLPLEESANYHTLGGLIINLFGMIPQSGDRYEIEGLRFEVVDMDGNRVDKVLLYILPEKQN